VVHFLFGNNVYFLSGILLLMVLMVKLLMIYFCFMGAIVIAPIGLAYLYYYHSKSDDF